MAKPPVPPTATDEEVRVILERYRCPVLFHEVRTRCLGNIATPVSAASPIKMVEDLWGGKLPAFDSIDAANELIGALVMGLWNRLIPTALKPGDRRFCPRAFRATRRDQSAGARPSCSR
jgi:hypothetical protein